MRSKIRYVYMNLKHVSLSLRLTHSVFLQLRLSSIPASLRHKGQREQVLIQPQL